MSLSQRIEKPRIRAISRIVDSVSFSGVRASLNDAVRGTINVTNNYKGAVRQPDGSELYQLSLTVDVAPEEGAEYYALSASVSGLFQPLSDEMPVEEIEQDVLSYGAQSLYGTLCEIAADLTRGGVVGELELPMISFSADMT